jgi:predicted transcriptional regulator
LLSPKISDLGDLLQWLAGEDPTYLNELEKVTRRHVANLLRNRAKTAHRRSEKKR